ncbi:MAG: hypothetical protein IJZ42_13470 [Lachnospiraceae bacterium]|nr:hypothetical protein [Lachnospiraceae bacterium]
MKNVVKVKQRTPPSFLFDANNVSVDSFVEHVDDLCKQYGLYGQIVERRPYPASEKTEKYVYFGIEPLSANADIEQIAVRPERNTNVFFPKQYAIKLDSEDETKTLFLLQSAIDYCRDAEFVKNIYYEFGAPIPDRILSTELSRLVELSSMFNNQDLGIDGKLIYVKSLSRFFKRERSKNPLRKKWDEYRRSDRFLYNDRNIFSHLKELFSKKNNVSFHSLQENCLSTSSAVLPAHRIKDFVKYMDEHYPEICYSIGPKTITDYGVLNDKQNAAIVAYNGVNPYGKTVDYETFCRVVDERFQTEGFSAIKELNPSKWEMHAISFSSSDEPFIAKAFNNINFNFAKKDSFQSIKNRSEYCGEDCAVAVPADDMLNFVSLANANGLHYFFDSYGYYGVPNFDTVNVAYNAKDQALVDGILTRMVQDRVNNGHFITRVQAPHLGKLNQKIQAAQNTRSLNQNNTRDVSFQER